MKKCMLFVCVLALLLSLAACNNADTPATTAGAITWEAILAANKLDAVLDKMGCLSATATDDDGSVYISYAAMVDGQLICSNGVTGYTDDLRDGVIYHASTDGTSKYITILAPTADPKAKVECTYGEELGSYTLVGDITTANGQYVAKLTQEDTEYGITTEGTAYFNTTTLLLDRLELVMKLGSVDYKQSFQMAYDVGANFPMTSYDSIVGSKDTVSLTIHYPDGSTKNITVDRNITLSAYYPDHQELWAVCWDADCTAQVDDLNWITGDSGDVYLCEGDIPAAPPTLSTVIANSTFDAMFKENYETYFQTTEVMDSERNLLQTIDLAWYMGDDGNLCLNFEIKDGEYNVIHSGKASENAWYSWAKEDGYKVDFYDAFTYAENLIQAYRLVISADQLSAAIEQDAETGAFYIPYTTTAEDGSVNEYTFHIHTDFDFIERVELTRKDSAQTVVGYKTYIIGGNGPIPGDMDIFAEIASPSDVETVKLTVVSAAGEQVYTIRKDAAISWKGTALYSDEARTVAVTDLKWVSGTEAKVYAK